jgi:threonine dehydrogenase-like Zn-dependent dehydrogenase
MLAAVKERAGPGVSLRDVPEPASPGPGHVVLRVEACGLCGTDVGFYEWREHLLPEISFPRVLGHEVVGTIDRVGEGVKGLQPGMRVATETSDACNTCRSCLMGMPNLCERQQRLGQQVDGGLATFVDLPAMAVRRLPDEFPAAEATLIQTIGVAVRAIDRMNELRSTGTALVFGPGPIGVLAAVILMGRGVTVAVVGVPDDHSRLELARALGAECIATEAVEAWLAEHTRGFGVDVAVEAAGSPDALNAAVAAVRPGGTVVVVGMVPPTWVDLPQIVRNELTVVGSWRRTPDAWHRATAFALENLVLLRQLIGLRVDLADVPRALEALSRREVIKAVVVL